MNAVLVSKLSSQLTSSALRAFGTSRFALAEAQKTPSTTATTSATPGKDYVSKDYYGYNAYSYFDIETEMVKYRLPQPSALPKNEFTYSKVLTPQQKAKANL